MKLKKIVLVSIFLLTIISLGAVNAQENLTSDIEEEGIYVDLTSVSEVNEDISGEDMQKNSEDKLSDEDVVGDITADNVTVDVSNVFEGQNASISVTVPEATGTVNITVGEKVYTPEFIGGVATQSISEYSIGLNNVTVKYNDIVKETSFKVLDGVITNESFDDYLELVGRVYYFRSFIPNDITLDFRGYIKFDDKITSSGYLSITKPYNITSTTGDAVIDRISIESGAINVSNINIGQLFIYAPNCNFVNLTVLDGIYAVNGFKIVNSTIGELYMQRQDYTVLNNTLILNCTINKQFCSSAYFMSNVSVINSTFNSGLDFSCKFTGTLGITNVSIKNCIINGKLTLDLVKDGLIENCTLNGGYMYLTIYNMTVKDNFINASSSTYGIILFSNGCKYNKITDNRIYSKKYYGNRAIAYHPYYDINFWPNTYNVFENNTPTQTDLNVGFTSNPIFYDETVTVLVNMSGIEGNVVFLFNGEKISTVKLVNGIATQTIDKYELGINNITVLYEDPINDIYAINHSSFKVNKVNYCPVMLDYDSEIVEKISDVNVILPKDANGNITFTLRNDNYLITICQIANGTNNVINVPALLDGNYSISATFSSIKYVTNSTCVNISVVHIPVYKLTANDIVMDYKDGTKYKVLVTKDGNAVGVGEIVKITFNGKTNDVKTDGNGYATLTLDASPKTYTIKSEYNGAIISSKVTIKNILKASNISKKKAKNIKFSVTLKTSKGKAIVGKKISFKFKGKTYTAKTNKKGVATITLKNLKVGKYSITSTYGACTLKNTIKIKK